MSGLIMFIRARLMKSGAESGMALVTVLGLGMFLSILMFTATGFAVKQVQQVRGDQDWTSAFAVAQAGVDDYVAHLNADGTYWR